MAKIPSEIEERIKRTIQDTVALDPLISLRKIQSVLESRNIRVANINYIAKLRQKIHKEALTGVDRAKLNERVALSRERHRLVTEELTRLAFSSEKPKEPGRFPVSDKDKIAALKAIVTLDLAVLKMETEVGIYELKLTPADVEAFRQRPVSTERLRSILDAMAAWNYTPPIPEELKVEYRIFEQPIEQLEAPQENGNTSPTITKATLV